MAGRGKRRGDLGSTRFGWRSVPPIRQCESRGRYRLWSMAPSGAEDDHGPSKHPGQQNAEARPLARHGPSNSTGSIWSIRAPDQRQQIRPISTTAGPMRPAGAQAVLTATPSSRATAGGPSFARRRVDFVGETENVAIQAIDSTVRLVSSSGRPSVEARLRGRPVSVYMGTRGVSPSRRRGRPRSAGRPDAGAAGLSRAWRMTRRGQPPGVGTHEQECWWEREVTRSTPSRNPRPCRHLRRATNAVARLRDVAEDAVDRLRIARHDGRLRLVTERRRSRRRRRRTPRCRWRDQSDVHP